MAAAAAAAAASKPPTRSLEDENIADNESPNGAEDIDLSSEDEGEAVDSDEVDSDALSDEEGEESLIQSEAPSSNDHELTQLDFIRF